MITNNLKTIYYRGYLKSCNYRCGYCPFSKNEMSKEELKKDKECLDKFIKYLDSSADSAVTVFFIPYGEVLIHDYYLETIADLSSRDYIDKICVQTNNSFDLHKLTYSDKIRLWCSYHPTQVSFEKFLAKCKDMYEAVYEFSVGAVADYSQIENLTLMRRQLPPDVYMWLNKLRKYSEVEIKEFLNIDPLFGLQLERIKSDTSKCTAGKESVYIDHMGNIYACNISKYKMGNIYDKTFNPANCASPFCSCFLAYSNRTDLQLLNLFKDEKLLRVMKRKSFTYKNPL